jgi:FkbM family methyltransferase
LKIFTYIRRKLRPLYYLQQFSLIRVLITKIKIKFYKKSKKFGNFFIYLPRNITFLLALEDCEEETFNFVSELNLKKDIKNKSFIDVGGNCGLYSLFFKKQYNSKIYIFEPDIENLNLLVNTKLKNKFIDFFIFPFALSNKNEIAPFLVDNLTGALGTLSRGGIGMQARFGLNNQENVICVKLDAFSEVIKDVAWIKIDVESHELKALQGMIEIIRLHEPNLIIEIFDDFQMSKIVELLSPIKYKVKKTDHNFVFYK